MCVCVCDGTGIGAPRDRERDRRFLCVPQRRVEFYACLIWKWIARECGSMRRVEGTES